MTLALAPTNGDEAGNGSWAREEEEMVTEDTEKQDVHPWDTMRTS